MNILIVSNDNNRNEGFIPLFKSFVSQGYGFIKDSYFIIDSSMSIRGNTKEELGFQLIQERSSRRGFNYTMYIIES